MSEAGDTNGKRATLSQSSNLTMGLALVLLGGAIGVSAFLWNLSDRFVTKEVFSARMDALASNVADLKNDLRDSRAEMRALQTQLQDLARRLEDGK